MRWLLRPFWLAAVSAILVLGAVTVVFQARPQSVGARPLPVAAGDHEIAWLYPATNEAAWERLVAAVGPVVERLRASDPGFRADVGPAAFPPQTTAVPEFALALPGGSQLVFRWYRLTSDTKVRDWVPALVRRSPPPLAIIGGNSSDAARHLARNLARHTTHLAEADRPLLLLTTATADRVTGEDEIDPDPDAGAGIGLNRLYPGRTFRFCFTNRQMAAAVTSFLWARDDLRPDADPVHMVRWEDDSYSVDLIDGFWQALRTLVARETVNDWAWLTGCVANFGPAPLQGGILPLTRAGPHGSGFRMSRLPTPQFIDSSVGTFYAPNRFEAQAARFLLLDQARAGEQRRPLLVATGSAAPIRRFVRALARSAPLQARRFVVATGDAIAFNTIYRDRRVAWPVQDLPFALVLFCHQNPVDPAAGFQPLGSSEGDDGTSATGTEDILLYGNIFEALAQCAAKDRRPAALAARLADLRLTGNGLGFAGGSLLFTAEGNRRGGTGEHVVCLRPRFQGGRVLPEATIEVWAWRAGASPEWQPVGEPLVVSYDEAPEAGVGP
jgi:hypothetical protein